MDCGESGASPTISISFPSRQRRLPFPFGIGQYEIVHNLGFGGYSTTWLTRDTALNQYVVLKVLVASESSQNVETNILQKLHTSNVFHPGRSTCRPRIFSGEPITLAADIWTLGVSLYEILGKSSLFETFSGDRDDILADIISTLGSPPARWWDKWENQKEVFQSDGSWVRNIERIYTPVFRSLHQHIWDMGRGETPETCDWDIEGEEMRALEDVVRGMLTFEPSQRLAAEQLMKSEYMTKWALPAWERQLERTEDA